MVEAFKSVYVQNCFYFFGLDPRHSRLTTALQHKGEKGHIWSE